MTWKQILGNYYTVSTLTILTISVYGCTVLTQNSQPLRTLSTKSDSGYSVAYSPARSQTNSPVETTLASAGAKSVKIWNPDNGQLLLTLSGQAWAVSFSPDGQILASGSQDGSLNLWDANTGKLIRSLKHSEPVIDIVFSPDGQTLASGLDLGSNIRLWNWRTGEIIRIKDDPNAVKTGFSNFKSRPITFSPDAQTLFARDDSAAVIQSWNVKTGELTGSFDAKSSINTVAISPDGKTLATGIHDNAIKLWNVSDSKLIHTLTSRQGEVKAVAFSPDGKLLASGSQDGSVTLWNTVTGELISTFTAHREQVWSIAFNPNGKTLASGSQDGTIKIWNVFPQ
ncbi:WD40 repeat domain-containing protein [Aliinostoc sp. HNIBRCY26]|uniref:WD40 repeat domain-containing protein n=1 Tax=Aliinostoc sp. HNIBRCY26 TaxID=3418997 RepID=UPI003D065102